MWAADPVATTKQVVYYQKLHMEVKVAIKKACTVFFNYMAGIVYVE